MIFENEELIFKDIPPEDKQGLREKRRVIQNTSMIETLQKIALPQRDNGKKFYVNERLDAIRERLADSGYHEIYAGDLTSVWSKKPLEELSGIEMPGMITAHIDIVNQIKKPFADNILTSDVGLVMKGTYDNLICDAALVEVMRGGNVPDNVFFCFDGDEETGQCRGFKEAAKWIEGQCGTKPAWAIATDVTEEGFFGEKFFAEDGKKNYRDHKDISIENLCGSWTFQNNFCLEFLKHKDAPKAAEKTEESAETSEETKDSENETQAAEETETVGQAEPTDIRRGSFTFVPRSTWNMPVCMKDYYEGSTGECDEAWTIKELGINGASLCMPIHGPMHSDKGCYARPESYLMFIDNLEMIGTMLAEMDRDKILGHDEQYDPKTPEYSSYGGYYGSGYGGINYSNYSYYHNYGAYDSEYDEEEDEEDEFIQYKDGVVEVIAECFPDFSDSVESMESLFMAIDEDWDYNYEAYPTWNTLQEKCEMFRDVVEQTIDYMRKDCHLKRSTVDEMLDGINAIPVPGSYEDYDRNTGFHQITLSEYAASTSKPKAYIKNGTKSSNSDPKNAIKKDLVRYCLSVESAVMNLDEKYADVISKACDMDNYEKVFEALTERDLEETSTNAINVYRDLIIDNIEKAWHHSVETTLQDYKALPVERYYVDMIVATIKDVKTPEASSKETAYNFDNYDDVVKFMEDEKEKEVAKSIVKTEVKPSKLFFDIDLAKFSSPAEKEKATNNIREINVTFKKGLINQGYSKKEARETINNIKDEWKDNWHEIAKNIHTSEDLSNEYLDFVRTNFIEREDEATRAYQEEAREEMEYGEPDLD